MQKAILNAEKQESRQEKKERACALLHARTLPNASKEIGVSFSVDPAASRQKFNRASLRMVRK